MGMSILEVLALLYHCADASIHGRAKEIVVLHTLHITGANMNCRDEFAVFQILNIKDLSHAQGRDVVLSKHVLPWTKRSPISAS